MKRLRQTRAQRGCSTGRRNRTVGDHDTSWPVSLLFDDREVADVFRRWWANEGSAIWVSAAKERFK